MIKIKFFPIGTCTTCYEKRKKHYYNFLKLTITPQTKKIIIECYENYELFYLVSFYKWLLGIIKLDFLRCDIIIEVIDVASQRKLDI